MSPPQPPFRRRSLALGALLGGAPGLLFLPLLVLPSRSLLAGSLLVAGLLGLIVSLPFAALGVGREKRAGRAGVLVGLVLSGLVLGAASWAGARAQRQALEWLLESGSALQARAEREGRVPAPDALPGWTPGAVGTASRRVRLATVLWTVRYTAFGRDRFELSVPRGLDAWVFRGGVGGEPRVRDTDTGEELSPDELRARLRGS